MAKLIVFKTEDEPELDHLLAALNGVFGVEILGVFKAPTMFCQDGRSSGYTWGKKFGWLVCADCGKPSEPWGTSFRAIVNQSRNLLTNQPSPTQAHSPYEIVATREFVYEPEEGS